MTNTKDIQSLPDYLEGIENLDETIFDEIFKNYGTDVVKFVKDKGGTIKDARHLIIRSLQWMSAHLPHHSVLHKCTFSILLQNLLEVFWELDHGNISNKNFLLSDHLNDTDCIYHPKRILVETIIQRHYATLHADCRLVLRCLWSGNPFDDWKTQLQDMKPEEVKEEKIKCIKEFYRHVIQDQNFVFYNHSTPYFDFHNHEEDIKLIDGFWDGILNHDDLKLVSDKMDKNQALKNAAYLIQTMRDVIRIPEEKISQPEVLNEILERKADKYIRPIMDVPQKGFNYKAGLWLLAIVIAVLIIMILFFNLRPENLQ